MVKIRQAKTSDAAALVAIYAPYVEETAITFEYFVPSVEEFETRILKTLEKFPYLVAEENGEVLGYAYASTYYGRAAYDWTVELSVYVSKASRGKKVGSHLYDALESALNQMGMVNLLACIALPNDPSIQFHKQRDFKQVAHFEKVGYKFGQWHDIVWLQKRLRDSNDM